MLHSQRLPWIALVGVAFVISFCTSRLVMRGQPNIRGFTLTTEVYGFAEGQPPSLRHRTTVAVRSDGATATATDLPGRLGRAGETERIVAYLDGRSVTFRPGIAAKTTFGPRPDMARVRRAKLFSPPPDCGSPGFEVSGHETIAGEPVVVLKHVSEPVNWSVTAWVAPRLGCEQLQYRSYDTKPDGTYRLTTEMRTVSLVMGEPNPQLFEEPSSGYEEMKPSDVVRAYDKKYGHIFENENQERLKVADQNYAGTLLRNPHDVPNTK